MATIVTDHPDAAGKLEVIQIDVSNDASCAAAAASLSTKGVTLFAVVNNAGCQLAHGNGGGIEGLLNTNFYGMRYRPAAAAAAAYRHIRRPEACYGSNDWSD